MSDNTLDVYNANAQDFEDQYLAISCESVHQAWLADHLPQQGRVLDVGAGVGRDALYFAQKGLDVVAVEPAEQLRLRGKSLTKSISVHWVNDSLPELSKVYRLQMKFDLILLSAVWMHITQAQRARAFRKLSNLLKPGGKLIISLRHGPSPDARVMYPVSIDELNTLAQQSGLTITFLGRDEDQLERPEVFWETAIIGLPDDGSGAFPLIRTILINDAKAATYKLALMRTLLRIADGHPGAVLRYEDDRVILPLGLVALYWARQYMPLLQAGLQQNSVASKGLAFVKEDGWLQLGGISAQDFAVGQRFEGEQAGALHRTLKHICTTIRDNPAKFITHPGTQQPLFDVSTSRTPIQQQSLNLDLKTLHQYGEIAIPIRVWQTMSQYACWIEPVAIQEWAQLMQRFSDNQSVALHTILSKLSWIDAKHATHYARQRVDQLLAQETPLHCVWSAKPLRLNQAYAIDHCLPFARWPNNDNWNLLPSHTQINLSKSDKLPSKDLLLHAKPLIMDWWQRAWSETPVQRSIFFSQASLTLPGLGVSESMDDVFEALQLQTSRIGDQQQLLWFDISPKPTLMSAGMMLGI
ncbi:methyltransferase domain-containing protein [Thiomicrospira microaerophila]|uniref:methyltransferase domain-containing protein n=1 Tax=Thiomicrospira microaerophila TaxID=406020 RepID=UPI0005C99711|nr:methyltransferase domain-containing protein [Thiomicrospira microaerophila]